MVLPIVIGAASAFLSNVVTKKIEEAKADEKLDLVKKLANLTPEQAAAVDAVKKQDLSELRLRVEHGIGPFGPLPETAAEQARLARQKVLRLKDLTPEERKIAAQQMARLTPEDRARVAASADPAVTAKQIAAERAALVRDGRVTVRYMGGEV